MKRAAQWAIVAGGLVALIAAVALLQSGSASAGLAAPAVAYQGRLTQAGEPADGKFDLALQWFGEPEGEQALGQAERFAGVAVTGGQFAVSLGAPNLADDGPAYLEVRVRPSGNEGEWTTLRPRQQVPVSAFAGRAAAAAAASELWRLGFTREGAGSYATLAGRVAAQVAAFRSSGLPGTEDKYFILPAPATAKSVHSARYYILSRGGSLPDTASLTLEVFNLDGTLQRTVSTGAVDLAAAGSGVWTAIPLSGQAADLAVQPGEFLAFRCSIAAGGNLDIRSMFEVEVR